MILKYFFAFVIAVLFSGIEAQFRHDQTSSLNQAQANSQAKRDKSCAIDEKCVPYYHCMESDGAGIFNIRSNFDENALTCDSLRKCCEIGNIKEEIPGLNMPDSCGYRNTNGLGYFSFGKQKESQYGEFPWTIAVLKRISSSTNMLSIYMGGGSLIHPQIVLTTAHNLNDTNPNNLFARGGEWNTQTTDEMLPHQERDVQGVTKHRDFTRKNLHNDIALIFLVKPFDLKPHINTICLPKTNYQLSNQKCVASGWGKDQFGADGKYQVFLKKVELPIVENKKCQEMLRTTRLGEDYKLHDGFMCAGGEINVDMCTGDGGGALACPIPESPGHYYQAGIISWGISCNTGGVPGVYISVSKYLSWINTQVEAKGFSLY